MALESAKLAPDIRIDKVEEARRKLQDPTYPTQEVIESVADGILKTFGIS
jgi:negative regulator of flagellin synthesis FlgM